MANVIRSVTMKHGFKPGYKVMVEQFDYAGEVSEVSSKRKITDSSFTDYSKASNISKDRTGVSSLEEALKYLKYGYQPVVEQFKGGLKANVEGQAKRISFKNDVVGYAPVVPLALMNVPTSMTNCTMKPIKSKVIDVYYDMTASWSTDKDDILKAGTKLLSAIMELEMQGYKFNVYACQTYSGSDDADMLVVKVKNSNTPIDLKRISFPLAHPGFFRVVGFDWYSRTPKGKYRGGYGCALAYEFDDKEAQSGFKELFGDNAVAILCTRIIKEDVEHIKKMLAPERKVVERKGGKRRLEGVYQWLGCNHGSGLTHYLNDNEAGRYFKVCRESERHGKPAFETTYWYETLQDVIKDNPCGNPCYWVAQADCKPAYY